MNFSDKFKVLDLSDLSYYPYVSFICNSEEFNFQNHQMEVQTLN